MKKEYTKLTNQSFDEEMNPIGELEEVTVISLIADKGKLIKQVSTGITGIRVDIGTNDSEDNYEEVDDSDYIKVVEDIIEEARNGL